MGTPARGYAARPDPDRHLAGRPRVSQVYPVIATGTNASGPFYISDFVLPHAGRWRLIATAGPDWGCFDLTLGP